MNQKETMQIYKLKQRILEQIWIETDHDLQYKRLKKVISETVESFLHPSEKGK